MVKRLPSIGDPLITAVSAVLGAVFVAMACWYAFTAAQTGNLEVHHLQWLGLSVLMLTALPSLTWDRTRFTDVFAAFGVADPSFWGGCAAWGCTAAAAAIFLPERNVRRMFFSDAPRDSPCS